MQNMSRLYEHDYGAWAQRTAELLRDRRFSELDIEHLIEELSDMGKSQRHELVSRLRVLLAHLLKWQFQYRQLSERWAEFEGKRWRNTIIEQRVALEYLLSKHPGLKLALAESVVEVYPQATDLAAAETELPLATFPDECPHAPDDLLDRTFYPDRLWPRGSAADQGRQHPLLNSYDNGVPPNGPSRTATRPFDDRTRSVPHRID